VRLHTIAAAGAVPADLTAADLAGRDAIAARPAPVFDVDVPANAAPMTLEELRAGRAAG
jgi:hypothetical protein